MARPQSRASSEESYFWIGIRALPLMLRLAIFASISLASTIVVYKFSFWFADEVISPIVDPLIHRFAGWMNGIFGRQGADPPPVLKRGAS